MDMHKLILGGAKSGHQKKKKNPFHYEKFQRYKKKIV